MVNALASTWVEHPTPEGKHTMRRLMSLLTTALLSIAFVAGLLAAALTGLVVTLAKHVEVGGDPVVIDGSHRQWLKYAGIALSVVAGTLLARREPVKSFLASRPVLWFLFLFNAAVAVTAYFVVGGRTGILTAVGMGVVSLGAGSGLLRGVKRPAEQQIRP